MLKKRSSEIIPQKIKSGEMQKADELENLFW